MSQRSVWKFPTPKKSLAQITSIAGETSCFLHHMYVWHHNYTRFQCISARLWLSLPHWQCERWEMHQHWHISCLNNECGNQTLRGASTLKQTDPLTPWCFAAGSRIHGLQLELFTSQIWPWIVWPLQSGAPNGWPNFEVLLLLLKVSSLCIT